VVGDKDEGGFAGLLGKAQKWLSDQGVTKEDLEKAKADAEAREVEQAETRQAEERAHRSAAVGDTQVTLRGAVNGTVGSGLAAKTEQDGDQLVVTVEPVDPVSLDGGAFAGFTFAIPRYSGPGTYDLGTSDQPGMLYELWLEPAAEGFFWAREYGPGVVTVSDGGNAMEVHFVYRDPGGSQVDLEGTVKLS
jgi:hypothetical protein